MVRWQGRDYQATEESPQAVGPLLFTVWCSIPEIASSNGVVSQPSPDRTSTILASGAPVHAVAGASSACAVAAQVADRGWVLFSAGC